MLLLWWLVWEDEGAAYEFGRAVPQPAAVTGEPEEQWRSQRGVGIPVHADNRGVYVIGSRDEVPVLVALFHEDGSEMWALDLPDGFVDPTVVVATDDHVLLTSPHGRRSGWFDLVDGELVWDVESAIVATSDDRAVVRVDVDGGIVGVDLETGEEEWSVETSAFVNSAFGDIVVGAGEDEVTAWDLASGAEIWSVRVEGARGAIAIDGGVVAAGNRTVVLSPDGEEQWRGAGTDVRPIQVADDRALVIDDAALTLLGPQGEVANRRFDEPIRATRASGAVLDGELCIWLQGSERNTLYDAELGDLSPANPDFAFVTFLADGAYIGGVGELVYVDSLEGGPVWSIEVRSRVLAVDRGFFAIVDSTIVYYA